MRIAIQLAALTLALVATMPAPSAGAATTERLRDLVEGAAADAARATVVEPDRFEVLSTRFAGADPVADGRLELRLLDADGPNRSGTVQLRFTILVDGRAAGEARASVRGIVRGPVLTARSTLAAGEPIPADAVQIELADLTRHAGEPLRSPAELAGLVPSRTLAAGRALLSDLLKPRPVVLRNRPIELRVRRGSLVVRTKGRVRRDAAAGETVVAENLRTGVEVLGLVQPDGSVLVTGGTVRGRSR